MHSSQHRQESFFCSECGTYLRKKRVTTGYVTRQIRKQSSSGLQKYFPYNEFRPFQRKAINFAFTTISSNEIGLLSSPCGTGKSISVLTAFFLAREKIDSLGRLLILTRTRNQLEIYCRELKKIKECSGVNFVSSIFKSRMAMCPLLREDKSLRKISYGDFLRYCRNLRNGNFGNSCRYYNRTCKRRKLSRSAYKTLSHLRETSPLLPDQVYRLCSNEGLCPYEITRFLTKYADIIVGNYNYLLVDPIRKSLLAITGIGLEEINCIFDEAHSLPQYATNVLSNELSAISVLRAQREAKSYQVDDFDIPHTLYTVMNDYAWISNPNYRFGAEHVMEGHEIVKSLTERLKLTTHELSELTTELSDLGEAIRCKKTEEGGKPISYLSRCANFLEDWISLEGSGYAKYLKTDASKKGEVQPTIGIKCLDPAIAAGVINSLRSSILMSGTLWNMNYYVDVLGIDVSRQKTTKLPSPFPRKNRLIFADLSVTTKYEKRSMAQWKKIADNIVKIVVQIKGRVAVYFPSYNIMHNVVRLANLDLPVFLEKRKTRISDVLNFMTNNQNCVVFGVARGKISEGVDMSFNGRSLLSAVVVVGLPYPKKTDLQKALIKYFREKFGRKSIEYAIDVPCLNALSQCAGRLLRSPDDKGIIVLMDNRVAGRFKQRLPIEWKEDIISHNDIGRIIEGIEDFMISNKTHF